MTNDARFTGRPDAVSGARGDEEGAGLYRQPEALFASTGGHYVQYRPSHSPRLVRLLVAELRALPCLGEGASVLDLGSGPGTLALDLAEHGLPVIAVDACAEMLAAGQRWAGERGLTNVTWVQADAHDRGALAALGPIAAVTIGDAFHWMDRQQVLRHLDELVLPGGLVALLGSRAPGTPHAWWEPLLIRLRHRYLGDHRLAGVATPYVEPLGGHEDVLRRSSFCEVTVARTDVRRSLGLEELIGLQMTYAYSSPAVLGDAREQFEADIRTVLQTVQPAGPYEADLQAALVIAHRLADATL